MVCEVDQRDAFIGMIKVGKQTRVFPFCTSAHKGQKLIKTMLAAEEASYHLPVFICRTDCEHRKGSGKRIRALDHSISISDAEKTSHVDHNEGRRTWLVPPGRNLVLDSIDEEVCDQLHRLPGS